MFSKKYNVLFFIVSHTGGFDYKNSYSPFPSKQETLYQPTVSFKTPKILGCNFQFTKYEGKVAEVAAVMQAR